MAESCLGWRWGMGQKITSYAHWIPLCFTSFTEAELWQREDDHLNYKIFPCHLWSRFFFPESHIFLRDFCAVCLQQCWRLGAQVATAPHGLRREKGAQPEWQKNCNPDVAKKIPHFFPNICPGQQDCEKRGDKEMDWDKFYKVLSSAFSHETKLIHFLLRQLWLWNHLLKEKYIKITGRSFLLTRRHQL